MTADFGVQPRGDRVDLAQSPAFDLGGLHVDPARRRVTFDGCASELEPRVMRVLVALAAARPEVVSRDQLVEACWDGRIVGDDAVNRCILALRNLTRGHTPEPFRIETIRGVGYSLVTRDIDAPAAVAPKGVLAVPAAATPAIAVLPFANISADPSQEYFAAGLTEEFICQLSQLSGLRVAGRTSAFAPKGLERDLRDIGRKLRVGYILEGSVRKAEHRLRITARLVDCSQGFDLWSRTFNRELGDVFAIQEEVAAAVCEALSLTLGITDEAPDFGGACSFEAYDHFLKAGRVWQHLTPKEMDVREAHLRQALAIDPDYALGWATLACLLTQRRVFLPASEYARVDEEKAHAARRAWELSPDLPEAHIAQGCVETDKRNWLAADEHCMRGVRRGPGHRPQAEHLVGGFLSATGRSRAGLPYRLASRDFDPLSMGFSTLVLYSYLALEAWSEFDAEYARNRDLEGLRATDVETLRLARLFAGGADDAAIEAQYALILEGQAHPMFAELAASHGTARLRDVIERWSGEADPRLLYSVASWAGAYGHDDLALGALRRAVPLGFSGMIQQCWFPAFRRVRQDPGFTALMGDVGLVDFWRRSGKWPDCGGPAGEDGVAFVR